MAGIRDISPSQWAAPGIAQVNLGVLLSAFNQVGLDLPQFLNNFSPTSVQTVNLAATTNQYTVPDTTNTRFVLFIAPDGNANTIVIKWNNADTGKYLNPEGFYFDSFDPNHMPTTLYVTAASVVNGCVIAWF